MLKKLCLRGVPYLGFGATVRVMVLIIVNLKLLAEFFRLHKSFFSSYSSVDFQAFDLGDSLFGAQYKESSLYVYHFLLFEWYLLISIL